MASADRLVRRVAVLGSVRRRWSIGGGRRAPPDVPDSRAASSARGQRGAGVQPVGGAAVSRRRHRHVGLPAAPVHAASLGAGRACLRAVRTDRLNRQFSQHVVGRGGAALDSVDGRPRRGRADAPRCLVRGPDRGFPGAGGRTGHAVRHLTGGVHVRALRRAAVRSFRRRQTSGVARRGAWMRTPARGRATVAARGGGARGRAMEQRRPGRVVAASADADRYRQPPHLRRLLLDAVALGSALASAAQFRPRAVLLFDVLRHSAAGADGRRHDRRRAAALEAVPGRSPPVPG